MYDLTLLETRLKTVVADAGVALRAPIDRPGAAVATMLRHSAGQTEVLLIKRAEHKNDPWSGHMAFPGGRHEADDSDLLQTAVRETREEIGIDLSHSGRLLGPLKEISTHTGRMRVRPLVFEVSGPLVVDLNREVDEVHWAPLRQLIGGQRDTQHDFEWRGQPVSMPGYRVGPHVVWGLTYQMLRGLFDILEK